MPRVLPSLLLPVRRLFRSRTSRAVLLLFALVNLITAWRIQWRVAHTRLRPATAPRKLERVYIASMHWNSAEVLRAAWTAAVADLAETLGRENVFISVVESGSWDDTKGALLELDALLETKGVPRAIHLSNLTHEQEIKAAPADEGWIKTPRGKTELRRIPFLAKLRNKSLDDLLRLHEEGQVFDKILFLNDVVFTTQDVLALLNTNNGVYAAACSLDFNRPPLYYDTFALRDSDGNPHLMQTWPYFESQRSRDALVAYRDAVPVKSCWNGIVAMPVHSFISTGKRLAFRGISDSLAAHHLEGSECCLIHADNPMTEPLGVYLNPRVRVGYDVRAYEKTHPRGSWLSTYRVVAGLWENRLRRLLRTSFRERRIEGRLKKWREEDEGNKERGTYCLINEMQVIVENGWKHL